MMLRPQVQGSMTPRVAAMHMPCLLTNKVQQRLAGRQLSPLVNMHPQTDAAYTAACPMRLPVTRLSLHRCIQGMISGEQQHRRCSWQRGHLLMDMP